MPLLGYLRLVALRKESVDRNYIIKITRNTPAAVALRKESVDRNKYVVQCRKTLGVALRKESVDRNKNHIFFTHSLNLSLSARRAWIEIPAGCWRDARRAVALRKESVDRNNIVSASFRACTSRSPQGERG